VSRVIGKPLKTFHCGGGSLKTTAIIIILILNVYCFSHYTAPLLKRLWLVEPTTVVGAQQWLSTGLSY
jgi:hypothetical protein